MSALNHSLTHSARLDTLRYLSGRFERALQLFAPDLPPAERFLCLEAPDRAIFLVKLGLLGGFIPPELPNHLRKHLSGRLVVSGTYRRERVQLAIFQISYLPQTSVSRRAALPAFDKRQVVVYGPTGGGKSSVLQHLLSKRSGRVIVIDPHLQIGLGRWHPNWLIVGAGKRYGEIEQVIGLLLAELDRRCAESAERDVQHPALHLAIDELADLVGELPTAAITALFKLVRQGRKYNVWVTITPHTPSVKEMGLEGEGGMRDSSVFVQMPVVIPGDENKPRLVNVYFGNPAHRAPDAEYSVPAPVVYQGQARRVAPAEVAAILAGDVAGGEGIGDKEGLRKAGHASGASQGASGNASHASQNASGASENASRPASSASHTPEGASRTASGPSGNASHASQNASRPASGGASHPGHTPEAGKSPDSGYEELYAKGKPAALELAQYLTQHGFSVRKISEALPYRTQDARETALQALTLVSRGERPTQGTQAEADLMLELHTRFGMPTNRIARLLDGADHLNLARVQEMVER